ncbi:hypothetical protein [Teredinibacter sp. KSP-S5-2]|uniref:hypothetical protein n=1 Tax=Teredinibacter sp. KSP-S5-2 TaxID=3034506 RepID=UPI002934CDE2|nr:hypothetical protein [Teredinibacter sp. KSP-S5-2]WNO10447.1 hypothetical protein P5V12_04610 [Teredinibacter sp. KSP-S5-2]
MNASKTKQESKMIKSHAVANTQDKTQYSTFVVYEFTCDHLDGFELELIQASIRRYLNTVDRSDVCTLVVLIDLENNADHAEDCKYSLGYYREYDEDTERYLWTIDLNSTIDSSEKHFSMKCAMVDVQM